MYRDNHRQCPSCGAALANSPRCGNCGGIWVSHRSLSERVAAVHVEPSTTAKLKAFQMTDRQHLACPVCGKPMRVARVGDEEVEVCKEHGVFFGPGELARLLEGVAAGHHLEGGPPGKEYDLSPDVGEGGLSILADIVSAIVRNL